MTLGLKAIIQGFNEYLEGLKDTSSKKYNTSNSEISIFMYADEFKNYISDELNVDPEVMSMSINDILDMEIVNGKLVDPESLKENELLDAEEKLGKEPNGEEEIPEEQPAGNASENDSALPGDISLTDVLNEVMEMDQVKEIIDADGSGELDDEEIAAFLNSIKGLDGVDDNISLEDILSSIKAINDGTFELNTEIDEEPPKIEEEKPAQEVNKTPQTSGSNGVSRGGGSSGVYGGGQTQGVQEKTLDNMSKEELNSELSNAQSDLKAKQDALTTTTEDYQNKLNELDEQYIKDIEEIDKEAAETIEADIKAIEDKEAEINEKDKEISDQESTVNDCETSYNNAVSTLDTLKNSKAALESTDTSNMDSDKKAEISSKIAQLESKITEADKAVQDAKKEWDDAKKKLEDLNKEKEELETGEGGLEELKQTLADHEEEFAKNNPEIKQIAEEYHQNRDTLEADKENAITSAKAEIKESQNYVNEVQTAINNYDNKQTAKEYLVSDDLQAAIDWARQYDDMSQDQMRQVFAQLGYQFDYNAWCADFVRMALGEAIGDANLPEWYQNVENKAYCPNIQKYGEGHQISAEEAQPGDIVLYDWDGDGSADHVGLFVDNGDGSSTITAIEGNTSGAGGGSCVEEKARNRGNIIGIYNMHDR